MTGTILLLDFERASPHKGHSVSAISDRCPDLGEVEMDGDPDDAWGWMDRDDVRYAFGLRRLSLCALTWDLFSACWLFWAEEDACEGYEAAGVGDDARLKEEKMPMLPSSPWNKR
ncbi:hypothetical protein BT69DRAFT_1016521 [Atractiella rhizophila]|nr:hypothetical protein BT69DRAFT_1016521 [Atractiella rhizophila]